MTEFGFVLEPSPRYTARLAARVEQLGFDLLLCPDTQNLCADPYGELMLAAAATRRIHLGTGVTNPVTRVAAVTASAVASLQMESGGRAICGLGRGDSSAAHIGQRCATTAELRQYCQSVQAYLRGQSVTIDGTSSRLRWVNPAVIPPAPVDIACTGPETIRMAADVADRISFAVGADAGHLDWALTTLRARLAETGRDRNTLSVGAYLIVVCDPNEKQAIGLARMMSGLVAHFAGMKHAPVGHLPPQLKSLAIQLKTDYDMRNHNLNDGAHLGHVDDAFVEWFAICGPPRKCADRLGALIAKGLDHVYILGGAPAISAHGPRWEASVAMQQLFAEGVMPALRQMSPDPRLPTS